MPGRTELDNNEMELALIDSYGIELILLAVRDMVVVTPLLAITTSLRRLLFATLFNIVDEKATSTEEGKPVIDSVGKVIASLSDDDAEVFNVVKLSCMLESRGESSPVVCRNILGES